MTFDPLATLREAGNPIDQMSEAQRTVLATLQEHEVAVLVSVQRRLREAQGNDLEAHNIKML